MPELSEGEEDDHEDQVRIWAPGVEELCSKADRHGGDGAAGRISKMLLLMLSEENEQVVEGAWE